MSDQNRASIAPADHDIDDMERLARATLPQSLGVTATVISRIGDASRHEPTRCAPYDVEGLVAHLVSGLSWFAAAGVGTWFDPSTRPEPELGHRQLPDVYDTVADAVRLAWASREPFAATYQMPAGPTLGTSLAAYVCLEQVGHGIDLADAVDGKILISPEVVDDLLRLGRYLGDDVLRAPGMFGDAQDAPPNPSGLQRVRAFLGRLPD